MPSAFATNCASALSSVFSPEREEKVSHMEFPAAFPPLCLAESLTPLPAPMVVLGEAAVAAVACVVGDDIPVGDSNNDADDAAADDEVMEEEKEEDVAPARPFV